MADKDHSTKQPLVHPLLRPPSGLLDVGTNNTQHSTISNDATKPIDTNISTMNPKSLSTGFYGTRGERIRHVVHEGALRLPYEALEIMEAAESLVPRTDATGVSSITAEPLSITSSSGNTATASNNNNNTINKKKSTKGTRKMSSKPTYVLPPLDSVIRPTLDINNLGCIKVTTIRGEVVPGVGSPFAPYVRSVATNRIITSKNCLNERRNSTRNNPTEIERIRGGGDDIGGINGDGIEADQTVFSTEQCLGNLNVVTSTTLASDQSVGQDSMLPTLRSVETSTLNNIQIDHSGTTNQSDDSNIFSVSTMNNSAALHNLLLLSSSSVGAAALSTTEAPGLVSSQSVLSVASAPDASAFAKSNINNDLESNKAIAETPAKTIMKPSDTVPSHADSSTDQFAVGRNQPLWTESENKIEIEISASTIPSTTSEEKVNRTTLYDSSSGDVVMTEQIKSDDLPQDTVPKYTEDLPVSALNSSSEEPILLSSNPNTNSLKHESSTIESVAVKLENTAESVTTLRTQLLPLKKRPASQWEQQVPSSGDEIQIDTLTKVSKPAWFQPDRASDFEMTVLPEWFDESASHRTPETYVHARNEMISMYQKLGHNRYVTATLARRSIPGDAGSLIRLHGLLTSHALINEDAINDSAPTPLSFQQPKPMNVQRPPLQDPWSDEKNCDALLAAVVEQATKKRKNSSDVSVPVIDWRIVADAVGYNVLPSDCERQFLSMSLVNDETERERPTFTSTEESGNSSSGTNEAVTESAFIETIQRNFMQDLIKNCDPEIVSFVTDAALHFVATRPVLTTDSDGSIVDDLSEAQKATLLGLIAAQATAAARSEEDAVSRLLAEVVELRMQKLENRMSLLDDVEGMLEAERVALELERRDLYTARCRHWFGGN